MLCTSVCPSDALIAREVNIFALLERLKQLPNPVLGCNVRPDLQAHEKTECLGWLGEEYLIAVLVSVPGVLQLNLSACADCQNSFIVDHLKMALELVTANTGIDVSKKIIVVEDRSKLDYREMPHNRRSFFRVLKKRVTQEVRGVITSDSLQRQSCAYSQKKLPIKRDVINHALLCSSDKIRKNILTNYSYDMFTDENCDLCLACVAMCPTGALGVEESHVEERLTFDSSRCNGCQLCAEFCRIHAIQIKKGASQNDLFDAINPSAMAL